METQKKYIMNTIKNVHITHLILLRPTLEGWVSLAMNMWQQVGFIGEIQKHEINLNYPDYIYFENWQRHFLYSQKELQLQNQQKYKKLLQPININTTQSIWIDPENNFWLVDGRPMWNPIGHTMKQITTE